MAGLRCAFDPPPPSAFGSHIGRMGRPPMRPMWCLAASVTLRSRNSCADDACVRGICGGDGGADDDGGSGERDGTN